MRKIDTLVVDRRHPDRREIETDRGRFRYGGGETELLKIAASLEKGSEHPLAAAIVEGALARNITATDAAEFDSHTGKGVSGKVDGRKVLLGDRALLADFGVDADALAPKAQEMRRKGRQSCSWR